MNATSSDENLRTRCPGAAGPGRATFHLRATRACPVAQRAMVALAARGTGWTHEVVTEAAVARMDRETLARAPVPGLTLRRPGQADVTLSESLTIVELIEDLHPDQPLHPADPGERAAHRGLMALGQAIQARLSVATRAKIDTDLDLAVFRLREDLLTAEQMRGAMRRDGFSNVDVVFGATLWRLSLLDARFSTFFLTGLTNLRDWAAELAGHPAMVQVFDEGAREVYVENLVQRGAFIVTTAPATGWAAAVGGPHRGSG